VSVHGGIFAWGGLLVGDGGDKELAEQEDRMSLQSEILGDWDGTCTHRLLTTGELAQVKESSWIQWSQLICVNRNSKMNTPSV